MKKIVCISTEHLCKKYKCLKISTNLYKIFFKTKNLNKSIIKEKSVSGAFLVNHPVYLVTFLIRVTMFIINTLQKIF